MSVDMGSAVVPWTPTTNMPLASSALLTQLSTSPTLLPERLAYLISALSIGARVSLNASALFIEAILESARFSTSVGMGLTRRTLIAAIGSARSLHYVQRKLEWAKNDAEGVARSNDVFLEVLDKCTHLASYVIHHTFSLAELFAMSSFYFTINTIQTSFTVFEESVRMLDGLLGSNETSRALSSVITLVRQELTQDSRFTPTERSAIGSIATLTRALTAFACLQTATHSRSLKEMKLRVVYDCTFLLTADGEASLGDIEFAGKEEEAFFSDLRSESTSSPQRSRTTTATTTQDTNESEAEASLVLEKLEELCGGSEYSDQEDEDDLLPEAIRLVVEEVRARAAAGKLPKGGFPGMDIEFELASITTTTTTAKTTTSSSSKNPKGKFKGKGRRIARMTGGRLGGSAVSDITSEDTRMDTTQDPSGEMIDVEMQDEWVEIGSTPSAGRSRTTSADQDLSAMSSSSNRVESQIEMYDDVLEIPGALNGDKESLATMSRQDTLDHPEESRQRLQFVLKSMTKKFTRQKSVRRAPTSRANSPPRAPPSSPRSTRNNLSSSVPSIEPIVEGMEQVHKTPTKGKGKEKEDSNNVAANLLKAFGKTLQRSPSEENLKVKQGRGFFMSKLTGSSSSQSIDKLAFPSPSSSASASQGASSSRTTTDMPGPDVFQSSIPTPLIEGFKVDLEPRASNYPPRHLVENLQHFMRYSSAAYGQAFLRILGIGTHKYNFPHTLHHPNQHSFAHHVGIRIEDILLSSWTNSSSAGNFSTAKMAPIVNYVAVDHSISSIVLSCRGSLGLSDILVDLTCNYEAFVVEHGDPGASYFVHAGMFSSAVGLQRGKVHDTVRDALLQYPTYGLVLCGHSLGGGVAALLSILWSCPAAAFATESAQFRLRGGTHQAHPPVTTPFVTSFRSGLPSGRPISCYTYGVPCVASVDLAQYCKGLVISTVHNYDIVPTLSLGVLRDLKNMAMGLNSEHGTAEEIVGRVIGLYQRKFMSGRGAASYFTAAPATGPISGAPSEAGDAYISLSDMAEEAKRVKLTDREIDAGRGGNRALHPKYKDPSLISTEVPEDQRLNDWLWSLVKTMRAGNDNDKLYPPGVVYVIENYTVFISGETKSGPGKEKYAKRDGRRILLREVDDVERRFSEPIFGRTMMSDHSPLGYEQNVDFLYTAVLGKRR